MFTIFDSREIALSYLNNPVNEVVNIVSMSTKSPPQVQATYTISDKKYTEYQQKLEAKDDHLTTPQFNRRDHILDIINKVNIKGDKWCHGGSVITEINRLLLNGSLQLYVNGQHYDKFSNPDLRWNSHWITDSIINKFELLQCQSHGEISKYFMHYRIIALKPSFITKMTGRKDTFGKVSLSSVRIKVVDPRLKETNALINLLYDEQLLETDSETGIDWLPNEIDRMWANHNRSRDNSLKIINLWQRRFELDEYDVIPCGIALGYIKSCHRDYKYCVLYDDNVYEISQSTRSKIKEAVLMRQYNEIFKKASVAPRMISILEA